MKFGLAEANTSAGAPCRIWSASVVGAREAVAGRGSIFGKTSVSEAAAKTVSLAALADAETASTRASGSRQGDLLHRSTITEVAFTTAAALIPASGRAPRPRHA